MIDSELRSGWSAHQQTCIQQLWEDQRARVTLSASPGQFRAGRNMSRCTIVAGARHRASVNYVHTAGKMVGFYIQRML